MLFFPSLTLAQPNDPQHDMLHAEFTNFADKWIEKVRTNTFPRVEKKEIIAEGSQFTGRYAAIDPTSIGFSIKRSAPDNNATWIATLQYLEEVYENRAASMDEALHGTSFELVRLRRITEVFRYDATRKRWVE